MQTFCRVASTPLSIYRRSGCDTDGNKQDGCGPGKHNLVQVLGDVHCCGCAEMFGAGLRGARKLGVVRDSPVIVRTGAQTRSSTSETRSTVESRVVLPNGVSRLLCESGLRGYPPSQTWTGRPISRASVLACAQCLSPAGRRHFAARLVILRSSKHLSLCPFLLFCPGWHPAHQSIHTSQLCTHFFTTVDCTLIVSHRAFSRSTHWCCGYTAPSSAISMSF